MVEVQQPARLEPRGQGQTLPAAQPPSLLVAARKELPRVSGKLPWGNVQALSPKKRPPPDALLSPAHPAAAAQSPDPTVAGWRLLAAVAGPQCSPPDGEEEQCAEAPVLPRGVLQSRSARSADGAHRPAALRLPGVSEPQPQQQTAAAPLQLPQAPSPQVVAAVSEQIAPRPPPADVPGSLASHPRAWPL